jgi:cytochrome P450
MSPRSFVKRVRGDLPPGPRLPAIVQTAKLLSSPLSFAESCRQRYGDWFTLNITGNRTYVVVSDPASVREILSNRELDVGNDELRPMLGDSSLLVLNGDDHREHRRMLAPAFRGDDLKNYRCMIQNVSENHAERLQRGSTIDVYPFIQDLCLDIIARVIFGDRADSLDTLKQETRALIESVTAAMVYVPAMQWDLGPGSPGRKIQKRLRDFDESIHSEIRTRRIAGASGNGGVLDHLIFGNQLDGEELRDDEIRDEVVTLIMAGHEPTTAAISWALYWVHRDKLVEERLRSEVRAATDHTDLLENNYIDAVCNEVLRIIPIVPAIERCSKSALEIADFVIPAGCSIVPCIYLLHHNEGLYPEPSIFRPERFVERSFSAFEFAPFGGGSRACVGKSLAPQQIKIVLAVLLSSFEFRLTPGSRNVEPFTRGTVIRPGSALSLTVN